MKIVNFTSDGNIIPQVITFSDNSKIEIELSEKFRGFITLGMLQSISKDFDGTPQELKIALENLK